MNKQSAVTHNVLFIGKCLTKKCGEYIRKVHGTESKITVFDPASLRFASRDSLKKFIGEKDELVYVYGEEVSARNISIAAESGSPFVQLQQDERGLVTGFWNNVLSERPIYTVSSNEEIEALKACGQLAGATS